VSLVFANSHRLKTRSQDEHLFSTKHQNLIAANVVLQLQKRDLVRFETSAKPANQDLMIEHKVSDDLGRLLVPPSELILPGANIQIDQDSISTSTWADSFVQEPSKQITAYLITQ